MSVPAKEVEPIHEDAVEVVPGVHAHPFGKGQIPSVTAVVNNSVARFIFWAMLSEYCRFLYTCYVI